MTTVLTGLTTARHVRVLTRRAVRLVLATAAAVSLAAPAGASPSQAQRQPQPQDLKELSLEQLMQIDVTLATREPSPIRDVAAAIQVITADDIRRSGVTTIADALTLADGLHVARRNNGSWAISARGFNATSANKLLVMIDGRTEYSPLFTGVFWNMLDYPLEDIDRMEVIRGPGATLWGANAVNGVINIVTRHSSATQGTYLKLGSGNEDPAIAVVRHGGPVGAATYRVYGKFASRSDQVFETGLSSEDGRERGQAGFRFDGGEQDGDAWMFKGDAFHSRDDFPDRPQGEFTGLALQGSWSHAFAPQSRLDARSYYRREYRRVPGQLTHYVDTFDVDLQHAVAPHRRHRIVWGGGYRVDHDQTYAGTIAFDPDSHTHALVSVFGQDEIALEPNRLYTTVGLKMEHNSFTGAEWQPNVRARAHVTPRQMLWGSVSRAARRPTRLDVHVRAMSDTGALLAVGGGDHYRSETLTAAEIGYRVQPHPRLSLDATVFAHRYDDLRSQELPASGPPVVVGNTLDGRSDGVELSATVQPVLWWRTHISYRFLDLTITPESGSRDVGRGTSEANDPRHHVGVRTSLDLPRNVQLDALWRHVGELPDPQVPAYSELNVRAGWRVTPRVELAVAGQDLLHDHHPEFAAAGPRRVEFERSVRALMMVRY